MNVGDRAPDVEAPDQDGRTVRLADLLAEGPVVLFFYPRAFSPICTAESCHFRDLAGEFASVGANVVGISADDLDRQREFDGRHGLGFRLLSDRDRSIARAFGVTRPGPLFNRRSTFVIDPDGLVAAVINSELKANRHADEALALLRSRHTRRGA